MTDDEPADLLLLALRDGDGPRAVDLAERHPELASAGAACAAALGEPETLAAALAAEPELAATADEHGWPPLLYACASPLPAADPARAPGVARCVELLLDHGADPDTHTLFDPDDPSEPPARRSTARASPTSRRSCGCCSNAAPSRTTASRSTTPPSSTGGPAWSCCSSTAPTSAAPTPRGGTRRSTSSAATARATPGRPRQSEGMRWLLEHGADPNVPSYESQETPLHRAAEQPGRTIAELLVAHGADPNRPRADGRTPYVSAVRTGNEEVAALLLEHGADQSRVTTVDAFLGACLRGDETAARALLAEHPGLLDELADEDRDALLWAVEREREASVRLLADLGFDLARESPEAGTPLHWAAWFGRTDMVELLLELGAPIDVRDSRFGSSPLGWAAHGSANCRDADDDYSRIVEALLDAGAGRDAATNQWDEEPESLASPRVAALLRERTSRERARAADRNGDVPVHGHRGVDAAAGAGRLAVRGAPRRASADAQGGVRAALGRRGRHPGRLVLRGVRPGRRRDRRRRGRPARARRQPASRPHGRPHGRAGRHGRGLRGHRRPSRGPDRRRRARRPGRPLRGDPAAAGRRCAGLRSRRAPAEGPDRGRTAVPARRRRLPAPQDARRDEPPGRREPARRARAGGRGARRAALERRTAAHDHRPRRHGQDAAGAPGRGRARRHPAGRGVLGAARRARRPPAARLGDRAGGGRAATTWPDSFAESSCCSLLDNFEHLLDAAPAVSEAAGGVERPPGARHEPRAAPRGGRARVPAGAAPGRRCRSPVRRPGPRGRRGARSRAGDRGDLPAAGRPPARGRAGGRPDEAAHAASCCSNGSSRPCRSSPAAPATRRSASAPCARRSTGATSSWTRPAASSSPRCRSSPAAFR